VTTNRAQRRAAPAAVNPAGFRVTIVTGRPSITARWVRAKPAEPVLVLVHDCRWAHPLGGGQASVEDVAAAMAVHTKAGCTR
jgi:hypothetical protein